MPVILVLLIIFPKISLANVCQKEINIYEYYFINGVGNTPRNIGESQEFINILNKIKDVKTGFLFN